MSTFFSKFNRTIFMTAFATCTAIMALGTAPAAFAATPADQSIFELGPGQSCDEGGLTNILGDTTSCSSGTPSAGPDWADIFDANGNVIGLFGGKVAKFIQDQPGNVADNTTYTSQGSDTNSQHPTEWTWTTASVPSKDDITNAYVYEKIVAGHRMIYVGAEREAPNGDSHIDFEFFQANVALDEAPPCDKSVCKFTGSNTDGDILISMDFTNGGDFAGLSIRKRHEGVKSKQVDTVLGKIATGDNYDLVAVVPAGCNLAVSGTDTVCAFSNQGDINGGPWVNVDAQGNEIFTLPKNAFTEWGIDLTALNLTAACLPSVLVKTRSSQSITAQLKDFALREFENCQAAVATQIHNTSHVNITGTTVVGGTSVHDKAIITGSTAGGTPGGTVTFFRWDNGTCSGTPAQTFGPIAVTDGGLVNGNPTAIAESTPDFVTTPGQNISFFASYSGDGNYPAVPLPNPVPSASCEPLTVATLTTLVSTTIRKDDVNGAVLLNTAVDTSGGTVNALDVATVSATVPSGVTAPLGDASCTGTPAEGAAGSVTFSRYTTGDCSGTAVKQTVCVGTTSFSGGIAQATATSSLFPLTTTTPTFLCYQAKYAGNAAYNASGTSKNEPLCAFPQVQP